ncbi:MAG: PrpF family protein [Hyphomicrobiaceae bacterium TMED74]|nr:PrpF family protein [Filomicrobium sp.]RPG45740.1 MAG: PrpF family protein [Hyphomicrobiaceae bacterium TMED74]
MAQQKISAAFIRGGTSKGVFFHARDLPVEQDRRDRIFLQALGSPDGYERQLNGLGGGISSLSKAVMIAPSNHPEADIDYTFAQVAVNEPIVDYAATCGNLSSAVGPFAIDEGLLKVDDGETVVRVFNTNTSKIYHARFAVKDSFAFVNGDQAIPGVSGTGAPIALEYLDPGGSRTTGLLPTGNPIDRLELGDGNAIEASLIDSTNPVAFVRVIDLKADISRLPADLDTDRTLMDRIDQIRRAAAVSMGMAETPEDAALSNPKIALVGAPAEFHDLSGNQHTAESVDICVRAVSMGNVHRALPLTLSMCLATACKTPGSIPNQIMREIDDDADVRLGNPSGVIVAGAKVEQAGNQWNVRHCRVVRTQRRLMEGSILIPEFV